MNIQECKKKIKRASMPQLLKVVKNSDNYSVPFVALVEKEILLREKKSKPNSSLVGGLSIISIILFGMLIVVVLIVFNIGVAFVDALMH